LSLSYFNFSDQVGEYPAAQNNAEKAGWVIMNGLLKFRCSFFILMIGVLVFSFYQFHTAPLFVSAGFIIGKKTSVYKIRSPILRAKYDSVST